jgi:tetratricopeptide (TPR) repeat protein
MLLYPFDDNASAVRDLNPNRYTQLLEADYGPPRPGEPEHADRVPLDAELLLGAGHYADALPTGLRLVQDAPDAASSWVTLASALRGVGYVEQALQVTSVARARVEADFELARFPGDTLHGANRFAEARSAYQSVVERDGELVRAWRVWYNYAECLYVANHVAATHMANRRALHALQRLDATGLVADEQLLASLLFYQGMLWFRMEQWTLAEQASTNSLRHDGRSLSALWLRNTNRKVGNWVAATLMLPWAARNAWIEEARKGTVESERLLQRAAVSAATLQEVQTVISGGLVP